jgi:hypothetical protein
MNTMNTTMTAMLSNPVYYFMGYSFKRVEHLGLTG